MVKSKSILFFLLMMFGFATHGVETPDWHESEKAHYERMAREKQAEQSALHKGVLEHTYYPRYLLLVNTKKLGELGDELIDTWEKEKSDTYLTIEQKDQFYLAMVEALPGGIDFSIGQAEIREHNIAAVNFLLVEDSPEIDFSKINFITDALYTNTHNIGGSFGPPSDPNYVDYIQPDKWTKETGLATAEAMFNKGATRVEVTLIFKDKFDPNLIDKEPYREVMIYLQDGENKRNPRTRPGGVLDFTQHIRYDHLQYIERHPQVVNVIPKTDELLTD